MKHTIKDTACKLFFFHSEIWWVALEMRSSFKTASTTRARCVFVCMCVCVCVCACVCECVHACTRQTVWLTYFWQSFFADITPCWNSTADILQHWFSDSTKAPHSGARREQQWGKQQPPVIIKPGYTGRWRSKTPSTVTAINTEYFLLSV